VKPSSGSFLRLSIAATVGGRGVEKTCQRGLTALCEASNGFLRSALTPEEMTELGLALYEVEPGLEAQNAGLFPWEASWYASSLPPVPARVLVLAAGEGRESRALLRQGYTIDALEPVRLFWERCRAVQGIGHVVRATFSDLVKSVLAAEANAASPLSTQTYDAAIVGWGGFNHVLSRAEQVALLETCCALSPQGPLLLSFYSRDSSDGATKMSRSFLLGRKAGRLAAHLRGVPRQDEPAGGFAWRAGLYATFEERDLHDLAHAVQRHCVVYAEEPYGYATLARD
jgi:hypothetical protein